ncbi:MAG: hypothetical protein JSV49_10670 [Thermoplasmata archaeon]|nr:MAG: hypothetical protein JSV49_10670 [Thermoplasmata archaeon]
MEEEMEAERPSFFARIKAYLSGAEKEKDEATYQRKLLDGRIEKYLDRHANEYIEEFGLVTSVDLQVYEERCEDLTMRLESLQEFAKTSDAELSDLERRVTAIKSARKRKHK